MHLVSSCIGHIVAGVRFVSHVFLDRCRCCLTGFIQTGGLIFLIPHTKHNTAQHDTKCGDFREHGPRYLHVTPFSHKDPSSEISTNITSRQTMMILNSKSNILLTAGFLAVVLLALPAPTNGFFFFLRRRMDELQDRMDKLEESSLAGSDPKVATIEVATEVMFGTDEEEDSSLGKEDDLPGLILRDPDGLRLLGDPIPLQNILDTNGVRRRLDDYKPSPGRILFGPTDDCTIGARSVGGIYIKDPEGLFIQNPNAKGAMSLRFGDLGECRISVDPNGQIPGMMFSDPRGFWFMGPQSATGAPTTSMSVDGPISARGFIQLNRRTLRRHLSDIHGIDNAME